jgi:hypothetical protein
MNQIFKYILDEDEMPTNKELGILSKPEAAEYARSIKAQKKTQQNQNVAKARETKANMEKLEAAIENNQVGVRKKSSAKVNKSTKK